MPDCFCWLLYWRRRLPGQSRPRTTAAALWHGNYTCGQGSTGLTLTIDPVHAEDRPSNAVRGLFEFYALQSNAGVPDGCFEMSGTVDPATTQVELTATRWLLHPPGYVTVNLSGHISHGQTMTGAVVGPSCTQFALRRIAPPRAAVTIPCRSNDTIASAR